MIKIKIKKKKYSKKSYNSNVFICFNKDKRLLLLLMLYVVTKVILSIFYLSIIFWFNYYEKEFIKNAKKK